MKELQVPNGQGLNLAGVNPGTAARNVAGDYGMMQGKALQNMGAHAQAAVTQFGAMRDAGAIMDMESKLIDMQDRYDKEIMKGLSLANNHPESLFDANGMLNETRLNSIVSKYQLEVKNLKTGMWLPDNALKTDEMKNRFVNQLFGRGMGLSFKQVLRKSRERVMKRLALAREQKDYEGGRRVVNECVESGLMSGADAEDVVVELNEEELRDDLVGLGYQGEMGLMVDGVESASFAKMKMSGREQVWDAMYQSGVDGVPVATDSDVDDGHERRKMMRLPVGISRGMAEVFMKNGGQGALDAEQREVMRGELVGMIGDRVKSEWDRKGRERFCALWERAGLDRGEGDEFIDFYYAQRLGGKFDVEEELWKQKDGEGGNGQVMGNKRRGDVLVGLYEWLKRFERVEGRAANADEKRVGLAHVLSVVGQEADRMPGRIVCTPDGEVVDDDELGAVVYVPEGTGYEGMMGDLVLGENVYVKVKLKERIGMEGQRMNRVARLLLGGLEKGWGVPEGVRVAV